MASSSFSSIPQVPQAEFNLFHTIDRNLFSRLLFNLRRDPGESMQVMALWLWFEQLDLGNQVICILQEVPERIINPLVDEAVMMLKCIGSEQFTPAMEASDNYLPLTQAILNRHVTLRYLHNNRKAAREGVVRNVQLICVRAFSDIVDRYLKASGLHGPVMGPGMIGPMTGPVMGPGMIGPMTGPVVFSVMNPRGFGSEGPPVMDPGFGIQHPHLVPNVRPPSVDPEHVEMGHGPQTQDWAHQRQTLSIEVSDVFSRLKIYGETEREEERMQEKEEVSPSIEDDRTIFLTFSKGYPIPESDVRDFITRRFGDIIDQLHMQEIVPKKNKQSLYARLVVKNPEIIDFVLEGRNKVKFIVGGRHMCARKYVPKGDGGGGGGSGPSSPVLGVDLGPQANYFKTPDCIL